MNLNILFKITTTIWIPFLIHDVTGQDKKMIDTQIDSLILIQKKLIKSLDSVTIKIARLEQIRGKIQANEYNSGDNQSEIVPPATNSKTNQLQIPINADLVILTNDCVMRDRPNVSGKIIKSLSKKSQIVLLEYSDEYYKVISGNDIGYVNELFIPENKRIAAPLLKSKQTGSVDTATSTMNSLSIKSEAKTEPSTHFENKTIYTGPRGGKYYINSKGKKVYLSSLRKTKK